MPARPRPPRGNFQRSHFAEPAVWSWRCSECGAKADSALHRREDRLQPKLYNLHQATCSPACALQRKTALQRERRAEKRRQGA